MHKKFLGSLWHRKQIKKKKKFIKKALGKVLFYPYSLSLLKYVDVIQYTSQI